MLRICFYNDVRKSEYRPKKKPNTSFRIRFTVYVLAFKSYNKHDVVVFWCFILI